MDLQATTRDVRNRCARVLGNLEVIAQSTDPIFPDPRQIMLELVLANHEIEAEENLLALRERNEPNPTAPAELLGRSFPQIASIKIPPMLYQNIDRLYLLGGAAGPSCLQLVNLILQYNDFVDQYAANVFKMHRACLVEGIDHLLSQLRLASAVADKCEKLVKPIHDSIKG